MIDEKNWIPPQDDNPRELAAYFASLGFSVKNISNKMGLPVESVENLLTAPKEKQIVQQPKAKNRIVPLPSTLADDFNSGMLAKELAAKYEVGVTLIWIWVKELGLKRKKVKQLKYAMPCKRELEILLTEKVTMTKMAEQYEVSRSTVAVWLKRYGLMP